MPPEPVVPTWSDAQKPREASEDGVGMMEDQGKREKDEAPDCPSCGAIMRIVRVVPKLGGLAELRTFRCLDCGEVLTREADQ
jgi:predicted RNA-binding Zn-ribbon protein involved in translation (DUF1610 family)